MMTVVPTRVQKMFKFWNSKSTAAHSSQPAADSPATPDPQLEKEIEELRRKVPIPSLWLFGKTGSGKSSIIRYLTGVENVAIGQGYRPETKRSQRYDFPDPTEPLLRFIDTRGLGESEYNPQPDIDQFHDATQLMIVAVRVTDHALDGVIGPLRSIRAAAPARPVLLVLTCLHLAPGAEDISAGEDPFQKCATDTASSSAPPIPDALQSLIDEKKRQFEGLYDDLIPIDLTLPEDGFADPEFGGLRLKHAILDKLPHAYRQALLALNEQEGRSTARQKRARWQVLASSAMAGTAGAVPLPWVDIPVVLAVQTHLAWRIAAIYEQTIQPSDWAVLSSAAGSRIAMRMALMEALKFIPFWGMAVGAASSFAFTYALGMSWDWYFAHMRGGKVPSTDRLREVFKEQLKRGHELWRAR